MSNTTALAWPTDDQLRACAGGLEPNDWHGFAERVSALCPALGAYEGLHADAADHLSPDVEHWARYAADDREELRAAGLDPADSEKAAQLWIEVYG